MVSFPHLDFLLEGLDSPHPNPLPKGLRGNWGKSLSPKGRGEFRKGRWLIRRGFLYKIEFHFKFILGRTVIAYLFPVINITPKVD